MHFSLHPVHNHVVNVSGAFVCRETALEINSIVFLNHSAM